jgi:hypothetical protein
MTIFAGFLLAFTVLLTDNASVEDLALRLFTTLMGDINFEFTSDIRYNVAHAWWAFTGRVSELGGHQSFGAFGGPYGCWGLPAVAVYASSLPGAGLPLTRRPLCVLALQPPNQPPNHPVHPTHLT